MKKQILTFFILVFLNFSMYAMNSNSWSIWIGDREIYTGYDSFGDTIPVSRQWFNINDTLVASFYECGGMATGAQAQVKLYSQTDQVLLGDTIVCHGVSFTAGIPVKFILDNWKLEEVMNMAVSLSIYYGSAENRRTYRIGVLRLTD